MADIADLYRDHHGWLLNWLSGRLRCRENAADVAQDTFVRLIGKSDQLSLNQPRSYLVTIARGLAIDLVRRRAVEQAYLDVLAQTLAVVTSSEEDRAVFIETLARIEAVLRELPDRARKAFLMSRLDGLGHREIAAALQVSLSTVEKDIAKALRCCYHARHGG
ncbi:MAG: sigma-70 family RNA polymerase sigma factor [Pseudomonadota bacterium]